MTLGAASTTTLAAAALVLPLGPAAAAPAVEPAPSRVTDRERDYASAVLHWTNVARRNHDLPPLLQLRCLRRAAQSWSEHLAATGDFEHQDLNDVGARCGDVGWLGENIAYHDDGPRRMVRMWMRSDGHRANILDPDFTHLGVGTSVAGRRWYGTQDFAGLR